IPTPFPSACLPIDRPPPLLFTRKQATLIPLPPRPPRGLRDSAYGPRAQPHSYRPPPAIASQSKTWRLWIHLGFKGFLRPLLALQIRHLGRGLPGLLVLPGHAQPLGTDEKSGPHAARSRTTDTELVSRQRRDIQRCCRGSEQQNPSGYQTILRLSYLRSYGTGPVSHVRTSPGTRIYPQILLGKENGSVQE